MRHWAVALRVILLTALVASCDDSTKPRVSVKARFFSGATPATFGSANLMAPVTGVTASAVPVNEFWLLSPDVVDMNLTGISLTGGPGNQTAVSCPVTFNKALPGLTQLSDCAFSVSQGTYTGVLLTFSDVYSVTITDAVNGFYSTATGIQTTPPAGGAKALLVTLDNPGSVYVPLGAPIVVTDTATVAASIVINGLQFFHVNVNGSTVALGWPGTSYTDPFRPDIVATVGSVAKVAFYASSTLNTAGSYCAGGGFGGTCNPPHGVTSVSVYYSTPTTPAIVSIQLNGTPESCGPIGASYVNDPRSYLGRDASGNLGWAVPQTNTWAAYSLVMRMAETTTIGASTTLYCKTQSTDPAPTGGSFSSGAPNIAIAGNSLGAFILLGK